MLLQPAPTRAFPAPASLAHLVPGLSEAGVDLLQKMLIYNPSKRISAAAAMDHPVSTQPWCIGWLVWVRDGVMLELLG